MGLGGRFFVVTADGWEPISLCLMASSTLGSIGFFSQGRCRLASPGLVFFWRLGHKVAKFRQVNNGRSNVHHDALEFPDGKTVLLTQLCNGQRATVLQLPACTDVNVDGAQRKDSTVASPVVESLVARVD